MSQKKYSLLYGCVGLLLLGTGIFLIIYGVKGLSATQYLIETNNIDYKNLFNLIKTFWITTILFVFFSSFLSFSLYLISKRDNRG